MKNSFNKAIILFSFLFLISLTSYCQDLIHKLDGEIIESEINTIDSDNIKYKKYDNLDGPFYIIKKNEVEKIIFKNGTEEVFNNAKLVNKLSLDEIKAFIVKEINEHGYEEDSFKTKYKASFEGNYLRLTELKRDGVRETNNTIIYDFSNVYKFQRVSKRSDKLAYINIYVSIQKKKDKFDKHKLIMRVDNANNAETILEALKVLNTLLVDNQ